MVKGERGEGRTGGEGHLGRGEIQSAIRRLKDGKTSEIDGVQNEIWRYGGEDVERWVEEFCNKVWRGKGWPEGWKEGIAVPIRKKREGGVVEDYRGVTLMSTLYKVYTSVLAERLREEVEEKRIVPHNQTGFRKGTDR